MMYTEMGSAVILIATLRLSGNLRDTAASVNAAEVFSLARWLRLDVPGDAFKQRLARGPT